MSEPYGKKQLREYELKPERMPHFYGLAATEYDKDELIKILAMSMEDTEREREFHHKSLSLWRTCSRLW